MPLYRVTAFFDVIGWKEVEAKDEDEAIKKCASLHVSDFKIETEELDDLEVDEMEPVK